MAEDDVDAELAAFGGDEFPMLPQPSAIAMAATNNTGRGPYERISLLRRSEGITGQPPLASFAREYPPVSPTSSAYLPQSFANVSPPSQAAHEEPGEKPISWNFGLQLYHFERILGFINYDPL